jgi:choline dehydrogenase-like flavoprotein
VNFRNVPGGPKMPNFLRGYAYGTYLSTGPMLDVPGFGQAYKKAVAEAHPTQVNVGGWGECLRYEDNYVDVDPNTVDEWGIPVARIHLTPRENELTMLKDMATAGAEMLEAAGCRNVQEVHGVRGQAHEVGAARMGTDPKTSVLTPHQNTHDIKNLFVLDGSGFPSVAWQNPTLTIMSLAVRASDYIMDQLKRQEL